ncbi:MAG: type II secretion system F family protein [Promethearchaeota archaeon]
MNRFSKICRFFSSFEPAKTLGQRLAPQRLSIPAEYYYKKLKLTPGEISSGAIGFGSMIVAAMVPIVGCFNWIVALSLMPFVFFLGYSYFLGLLPRKYREEQLAIAKYSELIIEEFLMTVSATGSIFDAVRFIAEGNYPYVSSRFKEMICRINHGEPPEQLITEFALSQPSKLLRDYLITFIATKSVSGKLLKQLSSYSQWEIQSEYSKFTMQVESRIMILVGIGIFFPIILGLGLVMWGFGNTVFMFSLIPIQAILLVTLNRMLLRTKTRLLGGQ